MVWACGPQPPPDVELSEPARAATAAVEELRELGVEDNAAEREAKLELASIRIREFRRWISANGPVPDTELERYVDLAQEFAELMSDADGIAQLQGHVQWASEAKLPHVQAPLMLALAQWLSHAGQISAARRTLEDLVALLLALHDLTPSFKDSLARAYLDLGDIDRLEERWDSAEAYFEKAKDALPKPESRWETAALTMSLYCRRGRLRLDQGLPDLASNDIRRAQQIPANEVDREDLLELRFLEAEHYLAIGHYRRAVDLVQGELEKPPLSDRNSSLFRNLKVQALGEQARLDPKDLDQALWALTEQLNAGVLNPVERILCTIAKTRLHLLEDTLDAEAWVGLGNDLSGARDEWESIQEGQSSQPWVLLRLAVVETEWALHPAAKDIDRSTVRLGLEQALDRVAGSWSDMHLRKGGVSSMYLVPVRDALVSYAMLLLAEHGPAKAAEACLERVAKLQAVGSFPRALQSDGASIAQYREHVLSENGGALVLIPSSTHLLVVRLDRYSAHLEILPFGDSEWRLVRNWIQKLTPPKEQWTAQTLARELKAERVLSAELANKILTPQTRAALMGWSSLAIHGAELMEGLPVEALTIEKGQRLLHVVPTYDPISFPGACGLAQRDISASLVASVALIATTDVDKSTRKDYPTLANIPFDESGAKRLFAPYRDWEKTFCIGPGATAEALFDLNQEHVFLLQLIVHGVPNLELERSQGLVLPSMESDQDVLWAEDLDLTTGNGQSWPLIVLLSVCGSNSGAFRAGDPHQTGLCAPFLLGGSQAVVASAMEVSFDSELALTTALHQNLAQGMPLVQALHLARNSIAQMPQFEHPFHWAHTRLFGLPDPAVLPKTR